MADDIHDPDASGLMDVPSTADADITLSSVIRGLTGVMAGDGNAAFRMIFDHAGIGIYQTSPDGRFLNANPALAHMLGYKSPTELIDDVHDIGRQIYIDPQTRRMLVDALSSRDTIRSFLCEARRRDGSRLWVSESASRVRDENGRLVCYVGTIEDVSELIRSQDALRAVEDDFRAIYENASEGIYRSTPDGKIIRANPAMVQMHGFETEEEWKEAITDLAHDWYVDPNRRAEFVAAIAKTGRINDFISQVYKVATGETMWILENAREIRSPDGILLYYEGTIRDITAQRRAEDDLRAAMSAAEASSQAKSDFLASMSHELRTPLNAIIGFSDIIRNEAFGPLPSRRYRAYIRDIHESGIHLLQLIEDILDVSKAEAGQLSVDDSPMSLQDAICTATQMLGERTRKGKVKLGLAAPTGLPMLLADRRRVLQIAINLVSNAVKFTPPGGKVEVSVFEAPTGAIIMRIEDTGIGIPAQDQERVFEPFVQLNQSTGTATEGTGLGLPLTRKLVELHGGTLVLDSRPGNGTRIDVVFPKWRTLRQRGDPTSQTDEPSKKGQTQRPTPSGFEGAAIAAITNGLPPLR